MSKSLEQRARKLWDELYPHSVDHKAALEWAKRCEYIKLKNSPDGNLASAYLELRELASRAYELLPEGAAENEVAEALRAALGEE